MNDIHGEADVETDKDGYCKRTHEKMREEKLENHKTYPGLEPESVNYGVDIDLQEMQNLLSTGPTKEIVGTPDSDTRYDYEEMKGYSNVALHARKPLKIAEQYKNFEVREVEQHFFKQMNPTDVETIELMINRGAIEDQFWITDSKAFPNLVFQSTVETFEKFKLESTPPVPPLPPPHPQDLENGGKNKACRPIHVFYCICCCIFIILCLTTAAAVFSFFFIRGTSLSSAAVKNLPKSTKVALLIGGVSSTSTAGRMDKTARIDMFDTTTYQMTAFRVPKLEETRISHVAASCGGKILVSGGLPSVRIVDNSMLVRQATTQLFTEASDSKFYEGPNMRTPRSSAAGARIGNRFYVCGGQEFSRSNGVQFLRSCEYFDFAKDQWFESQSMDWVTHSASAVAYHNSLFIIGGWNETREQNSTYKYNSTSQTWSEMAPMRYRRLEAAAVLVEQLGLIVVCGGLRFVRRLEMERSPRYPKGRLVQKRRKMLLSVCEKYNIANDTWTDMPKMQQAKCGHALVNIGGTKVVTVGGQVGWGRPNELLSGEATLSSGDATRRIEQYDFEENAWSFAKATLPIGRHSFVLV